MGLWRRLARFFHVGKWSVDERGEIRRGDAIRTYSGAQIYPLDPRPEDIHYDDGCVGLSRECRYANQTVRQYSVGEHSVIVSLFVEQFARERGWSEDEVLDAAREGLLHDWPESILGDVPRPLKRQRVMRGYRRLEDRWWTCVVQRFNLNPTARSSALVKEVDTRVLVDEMLELMTGYEERSWRRRPVPLGAVVVGLPWEQAADVFTQRFCDLFPEFVGEVLGTPEYEEYAVEFQEAA